jgi:hypothetical protein
MRRLRPMLQVFLTATEVFTSNLSVRRSTGSGTTSEQASFSQSTSARQGLEQIQELLGGRGYMRDRGTGMGDLVITSRPTLLRILLDVEPHVIFKKVNVRRALALLPQPDRVKDPQVFLQLAHEVDAFATLNYSKTKRISAVDVERHLRSTGVLCPCNDFFASNSEEMASLG